MYWGWSMCHVTWTANDCYTSDLRVSSHDLCDMRAQRTTFCNCDIRHTKSCTGKRKIKVQVQSRLQLDKFRSEGEGHLQCWSLSTMDVHFVSCGRQKNHFRFCEAGSDSFSSQKASRVYTWFSCTKEVKFPTRLFSICAVSSKLKAVSDCSLYARLFPVSTTVNSTHSSLQLWVGTHLCTFPSCLFFLSWCKFQPLLLPLHL